MYMCSPTNSMTTCRPASVLLVCTDKISTDIISTDKISMDKISTGHNIYKTKYLQDIISMGQNIYRDIMEKSSVKFIRTKYIKNNQHVGLIFHVNVVKNIVSDQNMGVSCEKRGSRNKMIGSSMIYVILCRFPIKFCRSP